MVLCHETNYDYLQISARRKAISRSASGRWRGFSARAFFSFISCAGQRRIFLKTSAEKNAIRPPLRPRRNQNRRRKSRNPPPKNRPKKSIISWKKRKNGKARNTPNRKNFVSSDFEPFPQAATAAASPLCRIAALLYYRFFYRRFVLFYFLI